MKIQRFLGAGIVAFATCRASFCFGATSFTVEGTVNSRLEAVPGVTEKVTVPLTRTETAAVTEYLVSSEGEVEVAWSANQLRAYPEISVATIAEGENRAITLLDSSRATVAKTTVIGVSAPERSVTNPAWIGEQYFDELGWGEWTMDLDTALEKVNIEGGDARVLAMVAGELWCPHCQAMTSNCLEKAEFLDWARDNRVALVYIDQADGQVAYDDWEESIGSILNWNADSLPRSGRAGRSGAAYLSRHGVSADDAKAVYERNYTLSTSTWRAPSSTAKRLGNPTFLMLNGSGEITARVNVLDDSDAYPVAENVARFDAARKLESEADGEPTTTALSVAIDSSLAATLQINAATKYARVDGLRTGLVEFSWNETTSTAYPVTIGVYSGSADSLTLLASGEGSVDFDITPDIRDADELWVGITSFEDASSSRYLGKAMEMMGELDVTLIEQPGEIAFARERTMFFEVGGTGLVEVVRSGGSLGELSVSVARTGGDAVNGKRYVWTDTVLTWADGEKGSKTIPFKVIDDGVAEGRETFTLALAAYGSTPAEYVVSPSSCVVTINDSTLPELEQDFYDLEYYYGFNVREALPLVNVTSPEQIRAKRVSGSLPPGLRVKYDKKTASFVLKGVPTESGTYYFVYHFAERRNGEREYGADVGFRIKVRRVNRAAEMGSDPVNPLAFVPVSRKIVPLYDAAVGYTRLAGQLKVSIYASGRVSAAYYGIRGKATFSGRWNDYDKSTGAVIANFTKGDSSCALEMSPDGAFTATVTDAKRGGIELETLGEALPLTSCRAYVGHYTVTLPVPDTTGELVDSGTAWFALEVFSSGAVKYSGVAASGRKLSGKSALVADANGTTIPIFVSKSKGKLYLGAALAVLPNAKEEYEGGNPVIISSRDGVTASWSYKDGDADVVQDLLVYGGYYMPNFDLYTCCLDKYETTRFNVEFDLSRIPAAIGVSSVDSASVMVVERGIGIVYSDPGFTLKAKPKTGEIYGRTKILFADGQRVTCTYRAVALPGWIDCGCSAEPPPERPLVSGTAYFKLKYNGRLVRYTIPVDFEAVY